MNCPFCGKPIEEFEITYYSDKDNMGLWEEPAEGRVPIVIHEPKGICCDNCKPWLELYMRLTADELKKEEET